MTRKNGREKVNRITLKNKVEWYSDYELALLESMGILCEEVLWGSEEKDEYEESLLQS